MPALASSMMLRMIAMMPLSVGDDLFLHLPQFSGLSVSCEETESTPVAGTFGNARWLGSEKFMTFPIMKNVPAGESLSIFVPSTSVVKLPSTGINSNTFAYISTNAALGPVNPTRILTMPTIGLYGRYLHCELNYGFDPTVNMDVPILFSFSYNVSLFSTDLIVLYLPGFESKSESFTVISSVRLLDLDCKTDFFGRGSCGFKEYFYPVINNAAWNMTASLLTFTVGSDIRAETYISVKVPSLQGFNVPTVGSVPNSTLLEVMVAAKAGSQDWLPVNISPGVGALSGLGLQFYPPQANTLTEVRLMLNNAMSLHPENSNIGAAPDTIELLLPDFYGKSVCITHTPTVDFPFEIVCWDSDKAKFNMTVGKDIPRFANLNIRLNTAFGVFLPFEGLKKDAEKLKVSVSARFGNVVFTPIRNSPAVGRIYLPKITFNPAYSGKPSYVTFSLFVGMNIDSKETMTLHLPNFSSPETRFQLAPSLRKKFQTFASWNSASEEIVLTALMPIYKGAEIFEQFRTPINLPIDGIRWYSTSMAVSTTAIDGPCLPAAFESFNPVGSMWYAEIRVEPPRPGAYVAITIIFRPRQGLEQNCTVEVVLPGFSGKSWAQKEFGGNGDVLLPLAGSHPSIKHVTWVEQYSASGTAQCEQSGYDQAQCRTNPCCAWNALFAGDVQNGDIYDKDRKTDSCLSAIGDAVCSEVKPHVLTLFIADKVKEDALVVLHLSANANIKLPEEGLLPNIDSFTIASEQKGGSGSVVASQIWRSPGIQHIGQIIMSGIKYDGVGGPHANTAIDLELKFSATVTVFPGDAINLFLPNFSSARTVLVAMLSHAQQLTGGFSPITSKSQAFWNTTAQILTINVTDELPGSVEATVLIPRDSALRLPIDGVKQNQIELRMSVDAIAGRVMPTSIMSSPAVGSVSNTSSISFSPPAAAGRKTDITLSFSTKMRVEVGDVARLILPLFARANSSMEFKLLDSSRTFLNASWDEAFQSVVFRCNKTLEPNSIVTILVSDFIVPLVGVRRNQTDITLAIEARDGPMFQTPVIKTPGIGSVTDTSALTYDPISASVSIDIIFSFVPQMDLVPGDVITLTLPDFYRSNLLSQGLEYKCTSVLFDFLGNKHCSGEYICVSDLCNAPLSFVSSPINALQAVTWREMQSVRHIMQLPFQRTETLMSETSSQTYLRNRTVYEAQNISLLERVYELGVNVTHHIPRGTAASITTLRNSQMKSPPKGLSANNVNLTVAIKSAEGSMPATTVVTSEAFGYLFKTSILEYEYPQSDSVSGISFTFVCPIALAVNDNLTLWLPEFSQETFGSRIFNVQVFVQLVGQSNWTESTELKSKGSFFGTRLTKDGSMIFKIGTVFAAETFYKMVIDSSAGVRLPQSLSENTLSLQAQLDSVNGFIFAKPIQKSTFVGTFTFSHLAFTPETRAGEASEVNLRYTPTMRIESGEVLEVQLPGFVRNNIISPVFDVDVVYNDSSVGILLKWSAKWLEDENILELRIISPPPQAQTTGTTAKVDLDISIRLPRSVGFIVPPKGVRNENSIEVNPDDNFGSRIIAKAGSIFFWMRFKRIDAVGSFWPQDSNFISMVPGSILRQPSLRFLRPSVPTSRSTIPSAIDISFQPQMPIEGGEIIEFTFRNFNSASKSNITLSGQSKYFASASWEYYERFQNVPAYLLLGHDVQSLMRSNRDTACVLRLTARALVPARENIVLSIPSAAGILLPSEGVPQNTIWVQTRAQQGPVVSSPLYYLPVGSFTTSTTLDIVNPRAGQGTDIIFYFVPCMPILKNEFLIISLPFWQAPARDFQVTCNPPGMLMYASWTSSRYELEFTIHNDIPANTSVRVSILQAMSNLILPLDGVRDKDLRYYISCRASAGIVSRDPLWTVPPVGSFYRTTTLDLAPLRAGALAQLTLAFAPKMEILPHEIIILKLPNFSLASENGSFSEYLTCIPEGAVQASWDPAREALMFTASKILPIDAYVTIILKSRLKIPNTGLRSNTRLRTSPGENFDSASRCPDFSDFSFCRSCDRSDLSGLQLPEISTNSRLGPVLPVRVYRTTAIGFFLQDEIIFTPPQAGVPVRVDISFVPMMTLQKGKTVVVILPHFEVLTAEGSINGSIFDAFSWNPDTFELTLSVGRQCVQRGENVKLVLPPSVGIMIGLEFGVTSANPPSFYTESEDGPILPTVFGKFIKIGSFNRGLVRYEPPQVNAMVAIVTQFEPSMPLALGETIVLTLTSVEVLDGDQLDYCGIPVKVRGCNISAAVEYANWLADWTGPSGSNCNSNLGYRNALIITIKSPIFISASRDENCIEMTISNTSRLKIMATGTTENDSGIKLSTQAYSGAVDYAFAYTIPISEQIRLFSSLRTSSISFNPARSNTSSAITFFFRFDVVMSRGDRILVRLPNFSGGPERTKTVLDFNHSHCSNVNCSWLTCSSPGQPAEISNGSFGPNPLCACKCKEVYEAVPLSDISSQSFKSVVEGDKPWQISEERLDDDKTVTKNPFSATWIESESLLEFTCETYLPTNYTTSIVIPESYKIRIPEDGVNPKSLLTIEANLLAGPLNLTSFQSTQPVGVFSNTRISFQGASPNSLSSLPCKILISFVVGFDLLPGDKVQVLKRFVRYRIAV